MREESISGPPYNPGQGGWPTIRYFNKETGVEGRPYDKKTDKAMCDELGDEEMMTAYVLEAGSTSFCTIEGEKGCDEREIGYIHKMKAKTAAERKKQLDRLENMKDSSMKAELKAWLVKRKAILQQFAAIDTVEL